MCSSCSDDFEITSENSENCYKCNLTFCLQCFEWGSYCDVCRNYICNDCCNEFFYYGTDNDLCYECWLEYGNVDDIQKIQLPTTHLIILPFKDIIDPISFTKIKRNRIYYQVNNVPDSIYHKYTLAKHLETKSTDPLTNLPIINIKRVSFK